MGYIFSFEDALFCNGCHINYAEMISGIIKKLALGLIKPLPGDLVIDIGCGTGASSLVFSEMGARITCVDPSAYMLDFALKNLGKSVEFNKCCAEELPFDDNSFNHAVIFSTLEFADNPEKVLEEAFRVTKDSVFIGFWNRYAFAGTRKRIRELFPELDAPYEHAVFLSIWEIRKMIRKMLGDVPVFGRSLYMVSPGRNAFATAAENSRIAQRFPLGLFVGLRIFLVPRYRTRPLPIRVNGRSSSPVLNGCGAIMEGDK